jgi:hypothetical protein
MRTGTQAMPPDQFGAACRAAGLMLHATIQPQYIALSGIVPPGGALDAARLVCAAWATPCLTDEGLRAAGASLGARQTAQRLDSPSLADTLFRAARFTEQPYRMNTLGSFFLTRRIAADDLARLHGDFISPRSSILVVEGEFNEAAMEEAIRTAWRKYAEKPKSDQFYHSSTRFELRSIPPCLVAGMRPEPALTAAVTRLIPLAAPTTLLVCGVPVPSREQTNYPPHLAQLVRGALLRQLDHLRTTWRDEDEMPVVQEGAAQAFDWYGVAWAHLSIRVPPRAANEGRERLQSAVTAAVRGLADGSIIPAARTRVALEGCLDARDAGTRLERMLFDELFGRVPRFSGPPDDDLSLCTPAACARMVEEYGAHTITVIASPAL